jgi:hypothetical protein
MRASSYAREGHGMSPGDLGTKRTGRESLTALGAIMGCSSVRLIECTDPTFAIRGVDARSVYAEQFWLPVLGPSTMWLLRYFAWRLELSPSGADLVLSDVARSLGLGDRAGRHAPFFRTVGRAIGFGMIRVEAPDTISSRRRLPLVSPRQLSRLPDSLRICHGRSVREPDLWSPDGTAAAASALAVSPRN